MTRPETEENVSVGEFITSLVEFMDAAGYNEPYDEETEKQQLQSFAHTYYDIVDYFRQPHVQADLQIPDKKLVRGAKNIARITVWCWPHSPRPVMSYVGLYFIFGYLLDDAQDQTPVNTEHLVSNFIDGKEPENPWLKHWFHILRCMLKDYGPMSQLNLLRTVLDYYECCWIESRDVSGVEGADYFPGSLRRLGSLGYACGACCFPTALFSEKRIFEECATFTSQVEPIAALVNDLFSFYKEFIIPTNSASLDENNLVNNQARSKGVSVRESFEIMARDTLHGIKSTRKALEHVDNQKIHDVMDAFITGYIRWHLSDPRYRMIEVYNASYEHELGKRFRYHCDQSWKAACSPEKEEQAILDYRKDGVNGVA